MQARAAVRGLLILGAMSACEPVAPAPDAPATTVAASLIDEPGLARRSTWRYWDQGGDLGTAWRAPDYDDRAWASGGGPLGYGEPYLVTTVGFGGAPAHKHLTTYARARFTLDDAAGFRGVFGEMMYDDGVVVYLNGRRLGSASMPPGEVTAATRAIGHETGNQYEGFDWSDGAALLVDGVNTIAVEIHQVDPASSDLSFDLALVLVRGPATVRRGADCGNTLAAEVEPRPSDLGLAPLR